MFEELLAALVVGVSFSNAFVCIFLVFGISTAEQRNTGKYFIFGRFLGLIILGLIIASVGLVFDGYLTYFMLLFGVLTIIFGALVITKMYLKIKTQSSKPNCAGCSHAHSVSDNNATSCQSSCDSNPSCNATGNCGNNKSHFCFRKTSNSSKLTKRYSFLLGVFRGATPCLKIFILAPLLIIVDLWLAFLMILVYALASTIYPIIGFLSANLLTNLRKYEIPVQVTGAVILISIGIFTIFKQLITQSCALGA